MPFIASQQITIAESLVAAMLASLSTRPAGALLATPTCHLFTATSGPLTPQSTTAQFTEATFTGYAAVTLGTLLGPILLPNNEGYGLTVQADFIAGSITPPGENILGYWIDNGSTTLYYCELFQTVVPISVLGDFISLNFVTGIDTPMNVA